jgi:hypothetical protein
MESTPMPRRQASLTDSPYHVVTSNAIKKIPLGRDFWVHNEISNVWIF